MARTKLAEEFEIDVEGEPYVWRLQRRPHWTKKESERRGMAIAIRHVEGQREAVVQFPPGPQPKYGASPLKAEQIERRLVVNAITSAVAAGWEPHSRGRTVEIIVDEDGH